MQARHKIDYYRRKQKGKYMETNSNNCEDSKLRPGDIANSFFDAFRSNAGQYYNRIQLSTMTSI